MEDCEGLTYCLIVIAIILVAIFLGIIFVIVELVRQNKLLKNNTTVLPSPTDTPISTKEDSFDGAQVRYVPLQANSLSQNADRVSYAKPCFPPVKVNFPFKPPPNLPGKSRSMSKLEASENHYEVLTPPVDVDRTSKDDTYLDMTGKYGRKRSATDTTKVSLKTTDFNQKF